MRRVCCAVVAAVALVLAGLGELPMAGPVRAQDAAEPASDDACQAGWRHLSLPASAAASRPYALVSRDDEVGWIVGGADSGPLVLERRGARWDQVDATSGGFASDAPVALLDAVLLDDERVIGAGYARPQRWQMEPYVGELQERAWRTQRVAELPGVRAALTGISRGRAGQVWAVGTRLDAGRTQAIAMRWDGGGWAERPASVEARESGLTAVTTTRGGTVWAAGWASAEAGGLETLLMKAGGAGLRRVPGPELPAGSAALTDIATTRGELLVSGYLVPSGGSNHRPFVARRVGGSWDVTLPPWPDDHSFIPRSLAIDADGGIWLAGSRLTEVAADPQGLVLQAPDRAEGTWLIHEGLPLAPGHSELFSVAATADGVLLSGVEADARVAVVLETCGDANHGRPMEATPDDTADVPATTDVATVSDQRGPERGAVGDSSHDRVQRRLAEVESERPRSPVEPEGFRIRDVSRGVGLGMAMHTLAGMAIDLDADGWDDLFIWSHADEHAVLRGGPDGFVPADVDAFGHVDRHGCTAADVDADDRLDVFCSAGRARGSAIDRHELSLAPGYPDGGPVADLLGVEDPFGRGRAATFFELDGDGLPDLFIASSPDRGDGLPGTNRVFRNVGGRFVHAPEAGLEHSTGGWCAVAADLDRDGDDELLHCQDQSDDARPAGLRVYVRDDGGLVERSNELGLAPIEDIDVIVAEMTGDRHLDIVQLSRKRLRVSRGLPDGTFRPIYELRTPFATGVAAGDVDGDGATDLYVVAGSTRGNEQDLLLVNDGNGRAFTSVRLPNSRRGSGADVIALDHDHNGLTDFVVLNGRGPASGPVRLLAAYPER